MSTFESIGSLFDRLAPKLGLDPTNFPDSGKRHEATLVWLFCGVAVLTWISHIPLYGILLKNIPAMLVCISLGLPSSLLGLVLIRFRHVKAAVISCFVSGTLTLYLIAAFTGGTWSPVTIWVLSFLSAMFLTQGVIAGLVYSVITIPTTFAFVFWIDELGTATWKFDFPVFSTPHRLFWAATYSGIIFVLASLSYIFESRVSNAFRRSERQRAAAEAARLEADRQRQKAERAMGDLEEQIAENKSLLNASEIGFCMIYSDFRIIPVKTSSYFQRLFPDCSSFRQVLKILHLETMNDIIQSVIGEDVLTWELNEGSFAKEVQINHQTHELAWRRIPGPNNETHAIIFVAKNVQPILDSKLKEETVSRYAKLLVTIVGDRDDPMHHDRESKSKRVIKAIKRQLPQIDEAIARTEVSLIDNWQPIFITLHTLKGEMNAFNFHELKEELHHNEEIVKQVRELARNHDGRVPEHLQTELLKSLRHTRERLEEIRQCCLQIGADQDAVNLSRSALLSARQDPQLLIQMINDSLFEDLHRTIVYFEPEIFKIAGDLSKPVPRLIVNVPHLYITDFAEEKLKQALTHVIRNALDHGIESRAERATKGKSELPTITFTGVMNQLGLELRIRDDGRGLDLEKIAKKAQKQGLLPASPSRQTVAELIFLAGFSTSDSVSLISGRGMGMEAVLKYIGELRGQVHIHLLDDSPNPAWELLIQLPSSHFPSHQSPGQHRAIA